jgi:hypothetical protein
MLICRMKTYFSRCSLPNLELEKDNYHLSIEFERKLLFSVLVELLFVTEFDSQKM